MKKYIFILLIFKSLSVFSQGEANYWYFGEYAGLNFNDCVPQAITDGELNTIEGCSTFSDPNGNLLFYSDGITVWNRNHDIMPNGNNLLGNPSSTQSAMIIPKPGSNSIYYIFTVGAGDPNGGPYGFNYYVVDMDVEGGFGDVIEGPIDLSQGRGHDWTEKVAAVKGAENGTFWVVSYVPNEFVAYKVTSDGVAATPVKSPAYGANDRRGALKLSPDGTKLAAAHEGDSKMYLYNFNDSTGQTSSELELPLITEGKNPYGVEFSANSEKLYVHATNYVDIPPTGDDPPPTPTYVATLFQFDVSLGSNSNIINSRTIIHESNLYRGSLQLGPDRRIYRSLARTYTEGIPQLGVIENPEEDGLACNYNHASIGLLGRLSTQGLPPFIASIFSQVQVIAENSSGEQILVNNGESVSLCEGDNISIFSESLNGTSIYSWYYNGGSTPISTDSILNFINITSANNGVYTLSIDHTDICGNTITLESEFTINVLGSPIILSPVDFNNCDEDGIADGFTDFNLSEIDAIVTIGDTDLTVTYHPTYNDARSDSNNLDLYPYNNATSNTIFARVENAAGCHSVATINLSVSTTAFPFGYTGETIETCDSDDINDGLHLFDLSSLSSTFLGQFPPNLNLSVHYYRNLIDAQLELNEITQGTSYMSETPFSQTLYVRVENDLDGSCFGIGPYLTLIVYPRPEFEVNPEAIICVNYTNFTTLQTFNPQGIYSYSWTGPNGFTSNLPTTTAFSGGQYTVTASVVAANGDICESFTKTVNVIESNIADIDLDDISITDDSANNTITINNSNNNLGIGDYEFSLDYEFGPYQDAPFFENVSIGIHTIYINDKNGCGLTSIEVSVIGFPKFFTPNNDGINDTWIILGVNQNFYSETTVEIYNRFGKILAIIKPSSQGWDGLYNGHKLPESDYWFKAKIIDNDGMIRNRKGHFSLVRRKP